MVITKLLAAQSDLHEVDIEYVLHETASYAVGVADATGYGVWNKSTGVREFYCGQLWLAKQAADGLEAGLVYRPEISEKTNVKAFEMSNAPTTKQ